MPLVFTLAARNLFHDRVRFVATLIGIIFSLTLVTGQLGLFLGFERMVTAMIDRAHADLWIAPVDTKSFEATALLDGHERFQSLPIEGVREVKVIPVIIGFAYWRKPNDGSLTPVFLVGVQPGSGGLPPWNVVEGHPDDLSTPDAVAIDQSYFERLGVDESANMRKSPIKRPGWLLLPKASGRLPRRHTFLHLSSARDHT